MYARKSTILDFTIACDVRAGEHSLLILLGGTSGCGKSTLASLLASRFARVALFVPEVNNEF